MSWFGLSKNSKTLPPPRVTQVKGSSATITGKPVSWQAVYRGCSNAPPPVKTIPRSAISEESSGGVCSSADFTALTMLCNGSEIA